MEFLELRTVMFSYIITDIVSTIVMIFLWLQNRGRIRGILFWVADFFLITASIILIAARGYIPDFFSIPVSNTLALTGSVLGYMGLRSFIKSESPYIHNFIIIPVFFFIHYYFTFSVPDLDIRNLNIVSALLFLFLQCAWLALVTARRKGMSRITGAVGTVFILFSIVNIVRIIEHFAVKHNAIDYFHSGAFSSLVILAYQMLFILLTYSLALMFNKKLITEIALQEEKFSKAFHSSAYAITLTQLSDGSIIEVNDAFCRITGYTAAEVLGKTTRELNLWERGDERDEIVEELMKKGRIYGRECQFRDRNGSGITGLLYLDTFTVNNERWLLSSINDITDRKRDELKIRALLSEKELMMKEVHHRIKNNMNTIFGLLSLQAEGQDNQAVSEKLMDAAGRVQSMSVLYDKLYRSDYDTGIPVKDYIPPLAEEIIRIFNFKGKVGVVTELEDIWLSPDKLSPVGIIINELITNSMKYAFSESGDNNIKIRFIRKGEYISIIYEDSGKGLPEGVTSGKTSGFGLTLVSLLAEQMGGEVKTGSGNGARFDILIMG